MTAPSAALLSMFSVPNIMKNKTDSMILICCHNGKRNPKNKVRNYKSNRFGLVPLDFHLV